MNEIFGLILVTVVALPTVTALLVLITFLLPNRTARVSDTLAQRSGRTFIVGAVNLLFFGLLAIVLSDGGGDLGGLIALIILLGLLGFATIGLAGMLELLYQRLYPSTKTTTLSPLQTSLRSALLLVLAMLTPVIGWFILSPILLLLSLGAGIISFARRKTNPST